MDFYWLLGGLDLLVQAGVDKAKKQFMDLLLQYGLLLFLHCCLGLLVKEMINKCKIIEYGEVILQFMGF